MNWFSALLSIIDKFIPSRKAAAIQRINDLTMKYAQALREGRDTDAALLKKEIKQLREKFGVTDGEV